MPSDDLIFAERALIGDDLVPATIALRGRRIASVRPQHRDPAARRLDPVLILAPGFVDLQVNGGGGILFNDDPSPRALAAILAAHRAGGTSAMLPTLITDRPERTELAADAVRAARAVSGSLGGILGLHLEGPFLSPARPGVHRPDLIREMMEPDCEALEVLAADASIGTLLVTLAPERVPESFLARLARSGALLSAGHTEATPDQVARAVGSGLRGFTHLWNAMPPIASREPGTVAAALLSDSTWCGLIADLIHVCEPSLTLTLRAKPRGRTFLVTDAMPPAGTDLDGFALQGRRILRRDARLTTTDGTLAGADLSMIEAVGNVQARLDIPLADALLMASTWPADFARLPDRGRIAAGAVADLLTLEQDGALLAIRSRTDPMTSIPV